MGISSVPSRSKFKSDIVAPPASKISFLASDSSVSSGGTNVNRKGKNFRGLR